MPAESLYDLHAFQRHFSIATQAALAAHGLDQAFLDRGRGTLPDSYLTISFETGEPFNEVPMPSQPALGNVDDHFAAQLTVGIRSRRHEDAPAFGNGVSDLHGEMESRARVALMLASDPFPVARLPYYKVIELTPIGTNRQTDPVFLEDYTELAYRVRFGIRAEAWPAA